MASSVSVRPRKQIDYKKLNEGEPLPSVSKVRVSRVSIESFPVERIITRRQSDSLSYLFIIFLLLSHVMRKPVYANNKDADLHAHPRSLISIFIIHCRDSITPLVSTSEISR